MLRRFLAICLGVAYVVLQSRGAKAHTSDLVFPDAVGTGIRTFWARPNPPTSWGPTWRASIQKPRHSFDPCPLMMKRVEQR